MIHNNYPCNKLMYFFSHPLHWKIKLNIMMRLIPISSIRFNLIVNYLEY